MHLILFTCCFLIIADLVLGKNAEICSNETYSPSPTTCYDNNLCPNISDVPDQSCGNYCYSPLTYTCVNNTLHPLPLLEGPYEIRLSNPGFFSDDGIINACNHGFFIGRPTCTWCPSEQFPELCGAFKNITALVGSSGMPVHVPGGQEFYINPIGTLSFTQVHSSIIPGGSIVGKILPFKDGGFVYAEGGGWYACPVSDPGVYQVVNRLEGVVLDDGCVGIDILTSSLEGGPFAWQYE